MPTQREIAEYIWNRAAAEGFDPGTALGIARGEGLVSKTINSSYFGNRDADGYSYGPFQLFSRSGDSSVIKKGGLAYEFQSKYGAAPSAANWKQQVDFSINYMKKNGTSAWYSVRDAGGTAAITAKGNKFARSLGLGAPKAIEGPQDAADAAGGGSYSSGGVFTENADGSFFLSADGTVPWDNTAVRDPSLEARSENLTQATDKQTEQQSASAFQQAQAIIEAANNTAATNAATTDAALQTAGGFIGQTQSWFGDFFVRGFVVALGIIFVGGAIALLVFKGDPKTIMGGLPG